MTACREGLYQKPAVMTCMSTTKESDVNVRGRPCGAPRTASVLCRRNRAEGSTPTSQRSDFEFGRVVDGD